MKKVQEFLKFTNLLILNVIRGFYLSNDRDLCHVQFRDICGGITNDVEYAKVSNLASIKRQKLRCSF